MTHIRSPRALGMIAAMLATFFIGVAALASAAHAAHAPRAQAARACSPPRYPGNGYFTSLHVFNTSCSTGGKVAVAWYHCRLRHGIYGHCNQPVLHFSCREGKRVSTSILFEAKVTCHRGSATVVHTYTQNH
jgi:hypothetical protein